MRSAHTTEALVIGDGCAALLTAVRLLQEGYKVAIVCPEGTFNCYDFLPYDGLSLWNAAFRWSSGDITLSTLWDILQERLIRAFPVSVETVQLKKLEQWTVLSSAPIHRNKTAIAEQDFFRLERKSWFQGQARLLNPDLVQIKFRAQGLRVEQVAAVEGALVRQFAVTWDPWALAKALIAFLYDKARDGHCFILEKAKLESRNGRRFQFESIEGATTVEYSKACYMPITGGVLPSMRQMSKADNDLSWMKGMRRRRKERQFIRFGPSKGVVTEPETKQSFWYEMGPLSCLWHGDHGLASWASGSGPDGFDIVCDEALRISQGRLLSNFRTFSMQWEWKTAQWKEGDYSIYWGTAFEGDLWAGLELIERLPL
jgi:hypothetical protein